MSTIMRGSAPVPDARDSLRRALREREVARDRGDDQTVALLDRVVDELLLIIAADEDAR